jgi:hypothetical protein
MLFWRTHSRTQKASYRDTSWTSYSQRASNQDINQKFNSTLVELEWVMFELELIMFELEWVMFELIVRDYHANVMIKQEREIRRACYFEEHTRKHEKHRIETHCEHRKHDEHHIKTHVESYSRRALIKSLIWRIVSKSIVYIILDELLIKSLIWRLSNLNESCSNLNGSCSNLNESCSNLSQKIITLTWWSNKN